MHNIPRLLTASRLVVTRQYCVLQALTDIQGTCVADLKNKLGVRRVAAPQSAWKSFREVFERVLPSLLQE